MQLGIYYTIEECNFLWVEREAYNTTKRIVKSIYDEKITKTLCDALEICIATSSGNSIKKCFQREHCIDFGDIDYDGDNLEESSLFQTFVTTLHNCFDIVIKRDNSIITATSSVFDNDIGVTIKEYTDNTKQKRQQRDENGNPVLNTKSITSDELYNALLVIKTHCKQRTFCTKCPLSVMDGSNEFCGLTKMGNPDKWDLVEPNEYRAFRI